MHYHIAVLEGDGIGPEITKEAIKVLKAIEQISHVSFTFEEGLIGGVAWQKTGSHLPEDTLKICEGAQAILYGAVGGLLKDVDLPKWKDCEQNSIGALRSYFHFDYNYHPIYLFEPLKENCLLKIHHHNEPIDIIFVRDLAEGIYHGKKELRQVEDDFIATDEMFYHKSCIRKIAHKAFLLAQKRKKKVTSIDKANMLATSKLWRKTVDEVAKEYPDCQCEHMLINSATNQMLENPLHFDVVLTGNLFGEILAHEMGVLAASPGMLACASLNDQGFGLYESPSGAANDIAGEDIANPLGQILAVALMLKMAFGLKREHDLIIQAIHNVLAIQYRTQDLLPYKRAVKKVTTTQMGDAVCHFLMQNREQVSD